MCELYTEEPAKNLLAPFAQNMARQRWIGVRGNPEAPPKYTTDLLCGEMLNPEQLRVGVQR